MDNIEDIKNILVTLPSSLQNYILDPKWRENAIQIAVNFGLTENQAEIVKSEMLYVLLGLNTVASFRSNIITQAQVTYDQALKITSEANSKIFGPVMTELKNIENEINTQEAAAPQATPTPMQTQPKPVSQPPKNLPTGPAQEHILTRQTETPVYKLPDHEHMKEQHDHTPTVAPSSTQPQTIVDQKLSQIVKIPKEEVIVDLDAIAEKRKNAYKDTDPYREPLE